MRLENEEEMSESNRPERVVWEEVIFSVTATQRCSLPDIMACSGERVCVLGGFFSVWSDHVDQLCISHISARLFTRHLYTQIEMVS